MKKVVLKEITLTNWRSLNAHHIFGENENRISGANKSGKSSIIAAWQWLLTGYCDSNTPQNSNLFDNRVELSPDTPTAKVEAVVSIDNEIYKIRREATASFQRKRGTSEWVKSASDTYAYYVDDVERSATDFKDFISMQFCSDDLLRYAISGDFFVTRLFEDKKGCRQLIERLVGKVERSEMTGDYADIEDLLEKFTLDEIDQRAQNMAKAINERLNEIPALIRTKEGEVSEIEQVDFDATDREIAKLEKEREDLDKQITDLTERVKPQMEARHEAERAKQMKEDVFEKAYKEWKKSFDTRRQKILDEIGAIRQQNDRSARARRAEETRRSMLKEEMERNKRSLELAKQKRERLLKERDDEKNKVLDASSTYCPHCGQPLQGEKLKEVQENFERVKRERIDEIVSQGKRNSEEMQRLAKAIEDAQKQLDEPLPSVIEQSTEELEKQAMELANVNTSKTAFMETEQGKALVDDIGSVAIPEVVMPETEEIEAAKKEVNERLVPLYERRGLKTRLETLRKQLDGLRSEQKEKGSELARYERQRQKVKEYKQEQMEILSRKVNDGLKFSKIEVWSKQKDGTEVPDLVLKDAQGVRFETTNGASRIVTTCDVQRFFCERLGINLPMFVDEATILNQENLPHYEGVQSFYLFCADTELTIERR